MKRFVPLKTYRLLGLSVCSVIFFLLSGVAFSAPFQASIEEIWDEVLLEVEFIVSNIDDDFYITNIAVENPLATAAWTDNSWDYPFVIARVDPSDTWYAIEEGASSFPVDWLTENGNLMGEAVRGFLYEGDFVGSSEGLAPGETERNFFGSTAQPASSFAVRWNDDGETTFAGNTGNTVPTPDVVWLLGPGLICLVGLRKKFKK